MENMGVRPREFLDYQEMNQVFDQMAAFEVSDFNLTGSDQPERVRGVFVSRGLFDLLGARQQAGRLFDSGEYLEGQDKVALISYSLWSERYGGRAEALGMEIILNGVPYSIVGIMPRGFEFQHLARERSEPIGVWLPLGLTQHDLEQGGWFLDVIGRLRPGITLE